MSWLEMMHSGYSCDLQIVVVFYDGIATVGKWRYWHVT